MARAEKVRGSVVGGSLRRSEVGQVAWDITGHCKNFAFYLKSED